MLKGEVKRKQPFKYISDSDKSCLLTNFEKRGWIEGSPSDYNFYWSNVGNFHKLIVDHTARLQDTQIINHFPNHLELTRKDLMVKNIKRYRKDWEKSNPDLKFPEFLPLTFILPSDYNLFSQEFKKNPTNNGLWIMKPTEYFKINIVKLEALVYSLYRN